MGLESARLLKITVYTRVLFASSGSGTPLSLLPGPLFEVTLPGNLLKVALRVFPGLEFLGHEADPKGRVIY